MEMGILPTTVLGTKRGSSIACHFLFPTTERARDHGDWPVPSSRRTTQWGSGLVSEGLFPTESLGGEQQLGPTRCGRRWQAQGKKWQDTGLLLTTALGLGAWRQDMCVPECPGLNQIRNSPVPYKASDPWRNTVGTWSCGWSMKGCSKLKSPRTIRNKGAAHIYENLKDGKTWRCQWSALGHARAISGDGNNLVGH